MARRRQVKKLKGCKVERIGVRDRGSGGRAQTKREDAGLKAGATRGDGKLPQIGEQRHRQGRREREELLPPIGGTREEIQRTLVETMEGILSGRIEPKEAYAIGRLCKLQLKLLGFIEQLEREMERDKYKAAGDRLQAAGGRRKRNGKGGPWVN